GTGERAKFIGEIRDISERLKAEAERDRLARMLRESIDNLPLGFTITGPDDRIVLCNEAYAQSVGWPVEQLIGHSRTDLIDRALKHLQRIDGQPFDSSPAGVERVRARMCRPSNQPIELEFASGQTMVIGSSILGDGSTVCVRTDITEIRRAERAIRESSEIVHRLVDACPIPIKMIRASDGLILYESPSSRSLYGREGESGPAHAFESLVDPADRERFAGLLAERGAVDGLELEMRDRDGRRFWAALSARLIALNGEEVIVSSSFDLTERRAAEAEMARQREALHQSEKLAALGELLAGVAHELNNPLSVVVGQALLLSETTRDPAIAERLAKIGRAADRCVRIVKTFLSMARRRPRRSESIDMSRLAREAVEVTRHALRSSGVELTLRLAPSLPRIEGDPDQIAQVLTNLVFNAEIALREMPAPRRLAITTTARGHGREVALVVRDNGPGIPAELQARVFEPFFTTRDVGSGTGIGLAFCHRVIESHGGRIRLDSEEGAGATFTILFPAADAQVAIAEPAGTEAVPAGRRILVIDDEIDVADVVAQMLRARGDTVEIALSGGEAVHRLGEGGFDAILSDLRMPGLDGERLYGLLSREHPDLASRIGFITGDAMGARAQRFLRTSGRPFLEKPITPADAARLVDAIVEGRAAVPA
ncbi:MAG: ATP-binding protein, partial [Alphaproteobacteria bacterium]